MWIGGKKYIQNDQCRQNRQTLLYTKFVYVFRKTISIYFTSTRTNPNHQIHHNLYPYHYLNNTGSVAMANQLTENIFSWYWLIQKLSTLKLLTLQTQENLRKCYIYYIITTIRNVFKLFFNCSLISVSLDTANERNTGSLERALEVEQCKCPVGYVGLSCEDCDIGYYRTQNGIYLGLCEACECNGHSNECDPDTGMCTVRLHVTHQLYNIYVTLLHISYITFTLH